MLCTMIHNPRRRRRSTPNPSPLAATVPSNRSGDRNRGDDPLPIPPRPHPLLHPLQAQGPNHDAHLRRRVRRGPHRRPPRPRHQPQPHRRRQDLRPQPQPRQLPPRPRPVPGHLPGGAGRGGGGLAGEYSGEGSEVLNCTLVLEVEKFGEVLRELVGDVLAGEIAVDVNTRVPGRVTFLGIFRRHAVAVSRCQIKIGVPGLQVRQQTCSNKTKF
ncbi:hypothetical protein Scep_029309 [Stephania cephalantha]|uniref:Uncharacterized protein n=1 Tax=Stephania cephalantha TaxID=152367 RepID=A0AAP0E545_9MAGN